MGLVEHRILCNRDLAACNSSREERVKPAIQQGGRLEGKSGSMRLEVSLPPASWNMIRLQTSGTGGNRL